MLRNVSAILLLGVVVGSNLLRNVSYLLDLLHKLFLFVNSVRPEPVEGRVTVVSSPKYALRQAQSERKKLLQEVY